MEHLIDEDNEISAERPARLRTIMILVGLLVTAVTFTIAYLLGTLAFGVRTLSLHEAPLERLRSLQATVDQVSDHLAKEEAPLLAASEGSADLAPLVARFRDQRRAEILKKGRQWPKARVYLAGDVVYFVFFDDKGVMRDFTCIWK